MNALAVELRGLSPFHRIVAEFLDAATRRQYRECWCSAERIADRVGCSARTVQAAVKALSLRGLVRVIRGRATNSGWRLVLLWRPDPDASGGANVDHEPAQIHAGLTPPPPDPPYKGPEGNTPVLSADAGPAAAGGGAPVAPGEEGRSATADDLAGAVAAASAVFGPVPEAKVREAVRATGTRLSWFVRAVRCADAKRRAGEPVGWGYLFGCLRNWRAEGGCPPVAAAIEGAAAPPRETPTQRRRREFVEACERMKRERMERTEADGGDGVVP